MALVWLGTVGWLSREPENWPRNPVAWWTADEHWSRPLWPMNQNLWGVAQVERVEGNPAFRIEMRSPPAGDVVSLGRWREAKSDWSLSLFVRMEPHSEVLPDVLTLFSAIGDHFGTQMTLNRGRLVARQPMVRSGQEFGSLLFSVTNAAQFPIATWVHVALVHQHGWLRLFQDGTLCGEVYTQEGISPHLAALSLEGAAVGTIGKGAAVAYDDVVLFDHSLSEVEMMAIARAGRGGWGDAIRMQRLADSVWRAGGLILLAIGSLGLIWILGRRRGFWAVGIQLRRPQYRAVLLTAVVGLVTTSVIAWALYVEAKVSDEQQFTDRLHAFTEKADTDFERIVALLERARDWVSAQSDLNQEAWALWLKVNHVPHDFGDYLVGVGYALQVLPGELKAHEAEWAGKHHYPYRIYPAITQSVHPLSTQRLSWNRESILLGDPRLPVVLFQPGDLQDPSWRTNETLVGRDLLTPYPKDPPSLSEASRLVSTIVDGNIQPSPVIEVSPAAWTGRSISGIRIHVPHTTGPGDYAVLNGSLGQVSMPASRWKGDVFASVDGLAWLRSWYAEDASPWLALRVYMGGNSEERSEILADSADLTPHAKWDPHAYLSRTLSIPFYHHRLIVDVCTTPVFEAHSKRNRPWYALGIGSGFTLLMSGLLFVEVRGREKEAAIAEQLRVVNAELARTQRERERLSRNLHDGTIQSLYAVGLHLQYAERHLPAPAERSAQGLDEGKRLVQETIVELREFLLSLKDETVGTRTYSQTIDDLVTRLRRTTPMEITLSVSPESSGLPSSMVVQLVHITREALSNAVRHGSCRNLWIRLESVLHLVPEAGSAAFRWRLQIEDDGVGFVPQQSGSGGFGLLTMRERTAELKGTLQLDSSPGHGTCVVVEFSVDPQLGPLNRPPVA